MRPARPDCPLIGLGLPDGGTLIGMAAADAWTLYGLDEGDREFLAGGGLLTTDTRLASAQRLTFTTAELPEPATTVRWQPVGPVVTVPTRLAPQRLDRYSVGRSTPVSLATPETLRRIGGTAEPAWLVTAGIDGPVTEDQRLAVVRAMSGRGMADDLVDRSVTVERGFRSPYASALLLLQGTVFALILVATVTATALSLGESRRDLATLAAIGSTSRTRRAVAAAQAASLALIGTLLGVLVGAVPGIAVGQAVTRTDPESAAASAAAAGSTLTIPWLTFAVAVIGVPLLAAAIASLLARRTPTLNRRTT